MNAWADFSDADEHVDRTGLIPAGTLVKVILKIKPGGYNDEGKGWTGDYATRSESTGSVYLAPEYTVIGGNYAKRKIWKSLIGLYSSKGETWGNSGRSFVRAMLESARGIDPKDNSEKAMSARRIKGFGDLNGLEFIAKVGIEKGNDGYEDSNKIETVIPVTHKDYRALMEEKAPAETQQSDSGGASSGKASWED
jgi:hypothetical protein